MKLKSSDRVLKPIRNVFTEIANHVSRDFYVTGKFFTTRGIPLASMAGYGSNMSIFHIQSML